MNLSDMVLGYNHEINFEQGQIMPVWRKPELLYCRDMMYQPLKFRDAIPYGSGVMAQPRILSKGR